MNRKLLGLVLLVPLVFLALFYFYPLGAILGYSFFGTGTLDLSGFREIFGDPYYLGVLWFTTWQAALSTLLTVVAALPAAYIFARYEFRGQTLVRALTTLPFLMPTIVVAPAFIALFGPRGAVNSALMNVFNLTAPPIQLLDTIWIIFLAHIFYNYTIVFRIVSTAWTNLDPQLGNAARMLGANKAWVFFEITLPLLMPAILAASLLVFIFDFTSFGVILILGGARLATLEVEIYRTAANLFDLPLAAALSLIQIGCTLVLIVVYTGLQARLATPMRLRPRAITRRKLERAGQKVFVTLNITAMLIFLLAPLVVLIFESLDTPGGFGLGNYLALNENVRGSATFLPPTDALRNSLLFASITVAVAVSLSLLAAYAITRTKRGGGTFDAVFLLPLATSAVTLGFGYILAFSRAPLDFRAAIWLIPVAHTLVALPLVIRSIVPMLRQIKPNVREAAAMLGANPARVFREVDFPIVTRAVLVGAVFAFIISLGEFGATTLIARPEWATMPLAIYRLLGQPGLANYGQAMALSAVLMLVSAVAIALMERVRIGEGAEF
ncbi:MAG: iron ABC transporter permease [Anaerolineae bacterium]|nr:iron ABC transporter permease [Anaerolineae bacterium]